MAIVRLEGLVQLKKTNYLIGNRTPDFPDCSIVPQPTTLTCGYEVEKNITGTSLNTINKKKLNSVAFVRKRTIPTVVR
jgi:hypothetical protein